MVHAGLAACSRGLGNRAWISGRLPTTSEAASGQEEARAPWGKAGTVVRRPMSAMRAGSWAQAGKGALGQHGHRVHRAGTVFTERGYVLAGRAGDRSLPGASSRGERVWSTFLGDSSVMDGEGAGTSGARPDPWAPSRLGSRGPRAGLFLQAPASPGRAEHGVRLARLGPTLSFERKCGWLPSPPRDSHGGLGWGSASRPEAFLPLQKLPGQPGGWAGVALEPIYCRPLLPASHPAPHHPSSAQALIRDRHIMSALNPSVPASLLRAWSLPLPSSFSPLPWPGVSAPVGRGCAHQIQDP